MTRENLLEKIKLNKIENAIYYLDDYFENQYIKSLYHVLINGVESLDRTGTGTIRLNTGFKFEFSPKTIPLLRGKYVNPWNALTEVIWIMTGRNDLKWLKDNGVNYWDQWVKEDGTFGPIYGPQMRNQNGFDQLLYVINKLNSSPESRQAMINLWHGADLETQALPTCHFGYHPLIVNGKLNLHCNQRSSDAFLGVPYDFMLFYFIQQILCFWTNTEPGYILHNNHDYHIYNNHYSAIDKYFDNYFNNPLGKFLDNKIQSIYINLEYPIKPKELNSESLTQWLYDFYDMNKNFESNYSNKENRYGLIKADVSV